MGIIDDSDDEWPEEIYLIEEDDLVLGGLAGPDNAAPIDLAKRTRFDHRRLLSLLANITPQAPGLGSELALANYAVHTSSSFFRVTNTSGQLALVVDTSQLNGEVQTLHPIMGAPSTTSPYGVHGALDVAFDPVASPNPMPTAAAQRAGIIRIVDATPVTVPWACSPPAAPASWARAYTKVVHNTTQREIRWGTGTPLDVMQPGEVVTYVRGPGGADWYRIGAPRPRFFTYFQASSVTVGTALTSLAILDLGVLQPGNVVDLDAHMNGTSSAALHEVQLEIAASATPGAAIVGASPTWWGAMAGSKHDARLRYTVATTGNHWAHLRGRTASGSWQAWERTIHARIDR